VADEIVLETATEANRVVLTYDRKDFSDVTGHTGVLIATEDMRPRDLRNAVERVSAAYPSLDDVVEYLSDWT
jgi:predicted nuclease of predicted toxin-antitoxin system